MATAVYGNLVKNKTTESVVQAAAVRSDLAAAIEKKLFNILDEDKKLDIPVFILFKDESVKKLSRFLAGAINRPVSLGIAGATASGKSTFAEDIIKCLINFEKEFETEPVVTRVNTDDYYYDRSDLVKAAGSFENFAKNYDFDVPEAIELSLLKKHIELLVSGNSVYLPKYSMDDRAVRINNFKQVFPSRIILSEGQYNLRSEVCDVFDFCIFVDVSSDIQKKRWFERAEKRFLKGNVAKSVFENAISKAKVYVKPTVSNADIVVSGEASRENYLQTANKIVNIVKDEYFNSLINQ